MNEVHLIGNLTKDCELNKSDAGVLYARFSIAVNKTFWKDNEKIEHTEFFNLVIFDRLAENLSPYLKKGVKVLVQGSLKNKTFVDAQKNVRHNVEINVRKLELLSKVKSNGTTDSNEEIETTQDNFDSEFENNEEVYDEPEVV